MTYTFPLEQQQQPYWCWCAVTVSIERYFNPHSQLTQESFAQEATGLPLPASDEPFFLSQALRLCSRFHSNPPGPLTFAEVKSQLDANLPVGVHIAWTGGGSHYVLITGYGISPGGRRQIVVSDPLLPDSNTETYDFDTFMDAYRPDYAGYSEGVWADTCLIKR